VSGFLNRAQLMSQGLRALRQVALEVAEAGLAALDPAIAVARRLEVAGDDIVVGGRRYATTGKIVLIGAGKASYRIALRAEEILGDRLAGGVVVVRRGEGGPLTRIEVMEADHPVPSAASVAAADAVLALADRLGPDDLALCCVTGGSSSLLCAPPLTVTLEEKQQLHRLLLSSGLAIDEINAVRKHVSEIKGGRLAARIRPATVVNLTVSYVIGDVLDLITGPTVRDSTTPQDAIAVLQRGELWNRVPVSIRDHLASEESESPDLPGPEIQTELILSSTDGYDAMAEQATLLGYRPAVYPMTYSDEAAAFGLEIAAAAAACMDSNGSTTAPCVLIACGGESIVSLGAFHDALGRSGPNQEVALAAATALDGSERVVVLSMDTDGSDGGTPYAGGISDGHTMHRARAAGIDAREHLRGHTAGEALERLGDLIETGATGTNVNDLLVVVVGEV